MGTRRGITLSLIQAWVLVHHEFTFVCLEALPDPKASLPSGFVDRTRLKGKDEPFEIVWDVRAATIILGPENSERVFPSLADRIGWENPAESDLWARSPGQRGERPAARCLRSSDRDAR